MKHKVVVLLAGCFRLLSQLHAAYPTVTVSTQSDTSTNWARVQGSGFELYSKDGDYSVNPDGQPEAFLTSFNKDGSTLSQQNAQFVYTANTAMPFTLTYNATTRNLAATFGQNASVASLSVTARNDIVFNGIQLGLINTPSGNGQTTNVKMDVTQFDNQAFNDIHLSFSLPMVAGEQENVGFWWNQTIQQSFTVSGTFTTDAMGSGFDQGFSVDPYVVTQVPEPSTYSFLLLSIANIFAFRRITTPRQSS